MSQDVRNLLAKNITAYRVSRSLSREELSLMLGVDNSYVSKLEKGRVNITIDKIAQLAELLDVKVQHLFND